MSRTLFLFLLLFAVSSFAQDKAKSFEPSSADLAVLVSKTKQLEQAIASMKRKPTPMELAADVAVYHKAAVWAARYSKLEFYAKDSYKNAMDGLERGLARAAHLANGETPWTMAKGRLVRGYVSRVDGSVQPYGLMIPANYQQGKPIRLDVNLHGRGATLTEVSFIAAHDSEKALPPEQDFIQLDVFGRTNNAYRWAGEVDVFEAIEAVTKQYSIDPNRILLRGFSMGGAGAWHIGLHFPGQWAAIEAGAGFTETMNYAKVKSAREAERAAMRIYDAVDYAANTTIVPTVGYGGEIDPQLAASTNIKNEIARLGLKPPQILFLVGPETAHKFHPDSKKISDEFLDRNLPRKPIGDFEFVTYTPRYGQVRDFTVDAMETLYERATLTRQGTRFTTKNVRTLKIDTTRTISLDGAPITGNQFTKKAGKWVVGTPSAAHKRRGLQGPIDDAFMDAFLCVYSGEMPQELKDFADVWSRYMRGDLPVREASKVTAGDMAKYNLVLWGTPSTNPLLGQIAAKLPIRWANGSFGIGDQRFSEQLYTLQMIAPNPLSAGRYVVLNSGHTFGVKEFVGTNALLYPRKGDWAVVRKQSGEVVQSGLFNSDWRLP